PLGVSRHRHTYFAIQKRGPFHTRGWHRSAESSISANPSPEPLHGASAARLLNPKSSAEDFLKIPASFCTHLEESVSSENEDYLVHYHVQDTPGNGHRRQFKGILADGNHLRNGRDDLLIDIILYFIAPHRFTEWTRNSSRG
ncbi:hypothetical protein WJX84_002157, partial [Apatococcus fuscideae]